MKRRENYYKLFTKNTTIKYWPIIKLNIEIKRGVAV